MILARVFNEYGHINHDITGFVHDLRQVIAKFMGRDEPVWSMTSDSLQEARHRHGEWLTLDGDALRVRAYLKGTAHLEVHPDMAWRLNGILAHLYPLAIPPQFRQKPKRRPKDFVLMSKPLPFAVLIVLAGMTAERHTPFKASRWDEERQPLTTNPFNRRFDWRDEDKAIRSEAAQILEIIGGVHTKAGPNKNINIWEFEYDPARVLGGRLSPPVAYSIINHTSFIPRLKTSRFGLLSRQIFSLLIIAWNPVQEPEISPH